MQKKKEEKYVLLRYNALNIWSVDITAGNVAFLKLPCASCYLLAAFVISRRSVRVELLKGSY